MPDHTQASGEMFAPAPGSALFSLYTALKSLGWETVPTGNSLEAALEWGSYQGMPPQIELLPDGRSARLLVPISYNQSDGRSWPVPAGAKLDGASIPRILWSLIGGPFEGRYRDASIVHDHYCDTKTRPWLDTHRMFYEAMRCSEVSEAKAKIMYYAVYRFGPRWAGRGEEGPVAPLTRPLAAAELAADATAIQVHDLDIGEIEALADARDQALDFAEVPVDAANLVQRARLLVVTGGSGRSEDLEAVAREVEQLPEFVVRRFEQRDIRVVACRDSITDFEVELRGVTPRGWEATGKTWDDVPGVYLGQHKRVVIATIGQGEDRTIPGSASGRHGSANLTLHECLHGFDYSGGHMEIREQGFLDARDGDSGSLDPYELQAGQAGLEETFAESGARFFATPEAMKSHWPHLFSYWRDEAGKLTETLAMTQPAGQLDDDVLGFAELASDRSIILNLRAEGPGGAIGHAVLTIAPNDPAHSALQRRLFGSEEGPIAPGRTTPFRPMKF